jgi:hypothetical protein
MARTLADMGCDIVTGSGGWRPRKFPGHDPQGHSPTVRRPELSASLSGRNTLFTSIFRLLVFTSLVLLVSAPAWAKKQELPEVTEDGLHRVHDSRAAIVYAKPGADLSGYRQIQLLDAYVAFRKNWERDQRSGSASPLRITSTEIEEIKNDTAAEFRTATSIPGPTGSQTRGPAIGS